MEFNLRFLTVICITTGLTSPPPNIVQLVSYQPEETSGGNCVSVLERDENQVSNYSLLSSYT